MTLSKNLKQRLLMSTIGSTIVFLSICVSAFPVYNWVFAFIVAVLICCALSEFYYMVREKEATPLSRWAIVSALLYVLATFVSTQMVSAALFPHVVLLSFLAGCFLYYFVRGDSPIVNMSLTVFGFAYLVLTLTCMVSINYLFSQQGGQDGRWWVFYLIAVTKMTDVGGYLIGKQFGTRQIVPFISPKKTVQGTVGGILFAVLTSVSIRLLANKMDLMMPPMEFSFLESVWFGGVLGVVSMFGDLSESLIKRDAKVKDSSSLPGLGGALDVVDSLVFTAPLVYLFLLVEI